jgi:RNA polymerase sigma-70 factor, ECF subfamily
MTDGAIAGARSEASDSDGAAPANGGAPVRRMRQPDLTVGESVARTKAAEGITIAAMTRRTAAEFETLVLPQLPAAYNYARWLSGNDADAQDLAQEASMLAWRGFTGLRGDAVKPWLFAIVRNCHFDRLRRERGAGALHLGNDELIELSDARQSDAAAAEFEAGDPESLSLRRLDHEAVTAALRKLPPAFREAVVLRDIEGLSYKEIAQTLQAPIGTVMSRLARGRQALFVLLAADGVQP